MGPLDRDRRCDQADRLCAKGRPYPNQIKIAASRGGIDVDVGYTPGAVGRSLVSGGVAQRFPAAGKVLVVRPYVKKLMGTGEDRISFNVFDEATQTYSDKFYASATQLLSAELHRSNGHRVRFGSDPKYPQFVERIEGVPLPSSPSKKGRTGAP